VIFSTVAVPPALMWATAGCSWTTSAQRLRHSADMGRLVWLTYLFGSLRITSTVTTAAGTTDVTTSIKCAGNSSRFTGKYTRSIASSKAVTFGDRRDVIGREVS
jgi:hypothetical protein